MVYGIEPGRLLHARCGVFQVAEVAVGDPEVEVGFGVLRGVVYRPAKARHRILEFSLPEMEVAEFLVGRSVGRVRFEGRAKGQALQPRAVEISVHDPQVVMGAHAGRVQGDGSPERRDRGLGVIRLFPGVGPRRVQAGVDYAEGLVQPRVLRVDADGALDLDAGGIVPAEEGVGPGEVVEGVRVIRVLFQSAPEVRDRFCVLSPGVLLPARGPIRVRTAVGGAGSCNAEGDQQQGPKCRFAHGVRRGDRGKVGIPCAAIRSPAGRNRPSWCVRGTPASGECRPSVDELEGVDPHRAGCGSEAAAIPGIRSPR